MDISCKDPTTGRLWDLDDPETIKAAWRMYYRNRPKLLICTPPCTCFSQIQNINGEIDPDRMAQAIRYIDLCIEFCRAQEKSGNYFVFEHPAYARSWRLTQLEDLAS